jgi:hypothetical protein
LTGKREIVEKKDQKTTQWVVYQDKKPTFYVDCFDLKIESNVLINNLILSERKKMENVLKEINETQNVHLSIEKTPFFSIEKSSEYKELELKPLPKEWLTVFNGNQGIT